MIETNEFTKQGLFSIQRYKTRLILKKIRENNSQDQITTNYFTGKQIKGEVI